MVRDREYKADDAEDGEGEEKKEAGDGEKEKKKRGKDGGSKRSRPVIKSRESVNQ